MKTLREVLQDAEKRRVAVGHFNFSELMVLKAVGDAARAMRHTSPETKRRYQLGTVEQVREAMERANQQVYGDRLTIQ
jgi:hypothetical protein